MEIKFTNCAREAALLVLNDEIAKQPAGEEKFAGIRIKVVGGKCAAFNYEMVLEPQSNVVSDDTTFDFNGLKIFVDQFSLHYLDGTVIDYVARGITAKGFLFNNPNVRHTCGCPRPRFSEDKEKIK